MYIILCEHIHTYTYVHALYKQNTIKVTHVEIIMQILFIYIYAILEFYVHTLYNVCIFTSHKHNIYNSNIVITYKKMCEYKL